MIYLFSLIEEKRQLKASVSSMERMQHGKFCYFRDTHFDTNNLSNSERTYLNSVIHNDLCQSIQEAVINCIMQHLHSIGKVQTI